MGQACFDLRVFLHELNVLVAAVFAGGDDVSTLQKGDDLCTSPPTTHNRSPTKQNMYDGQRWSVFNKITVYDVATVP